MSWRNNRVQTSHFAKYSSNTNQVESTFISLIVLHIYGVACRTYNDIGLREFVTVMDKILLDSFPGIRYIFVIKIKVDKMQMI